MDLFSPSPSHFLRCLPQAMRLNTHVFSLMLKLLDKLSNYLACVLGLVETQLYQNVCGKFSNAYQKLRRHNLD